MNVLFAILLIAPLIWITSWSNRIGASLYMALDRTIERWNAPRYQRRAKAMGFEAEFRELHGAMTHQPCCRACVACVYG